MHILGLETSCDETAAAVVQLADNGHGKILSSTIYTQLDHVPYGGVIPEIAARAHLDKIEPTVNKALKEAGLTLADIDGFAAAAGPGLLGGLLVGVSFAKTLAMATGKPYVGINHLEGHALTCHLTDNVPFPYLLLLASGGHCQFIDVEGLGAYTLLGGTLDDAAGEAFDKVAKLMGLGMPGGPLIEQRAKEGNPNAYPFPIPMKNKGLDMSFSGLKTAVRTLVQNITAEEGHLSDTHINDIAASFQQTVARTLAHKADVALAQTKRPHLVVAGGVAANQTLRAHLQDIAQKHGAQFHAPPLKLCTDNGAMIAYAGALHLAAGHQSPLGSGATPHWPLSAGHPMSEQAL